MVVWSGVLIVLLVILFLVASAIRRWLKRDEVSPALGFTLGDLRALHRQGRMTDEEFERAKGQMMGQAKRDAIAALDANRSKPQAVAGSKHSSAEDLAAYARTLQVEAEERAEQDRPAADDTKGGIPGAKPEAKPPSPGDPTEK